MTIVLYWWRNGKKEYLFSVRFSEFDKFIGLIESIKFKRQGRLIADIVEDDGVYRKHIESGVDMETLFNVFLEYKEDVDEYFDYERFYPESSQDNTLGEVGGVMIGYPYK